jgi:hypothetical protein
MWTRVGPGPQPLSRDERSWPLPAGDGGLGRLDGRDARLRHRSALEEARNLAANPPGVVHLESGDDVVIREGVVAKVAAPRRPALVEDVDVAKYGARFAEVPGAVPVWGFRARVAFAWREKDVTGSVTRWVLGADR